MIEPIFIEQRNEHEYQAHNVPRNETLFLQVENFDIAIKRTDEGIVIDLFDFDEETYEETLGSMYAFDTDTKSFQGGP